MCLRLMSKQDQQVIFGCIFLQSDGTDVTVDVHLVEFMFQLFCEKSVENIFSILLQFASVPAFVTTTKINAGWQMLKLPFLEYSEKVLIEGYLNCFQSTQQVVIKEQKCKSVKQAS